MTKTWMWFTKCSTNTWSDSKFICSWDYEVGFHSRCCRSIQDKVRLHEVQLWKQDTKLHEWGKTPNLLKDHQASGIMSNTVVFRLCSQVVDATKTIQKAKVREEFLKASKSLRERLKAAGFNGCYFDRTEKEPQRLCTREGWFTCQVLLEETKGADRPTAEWARKHDRFWDVRQKPLNQQNPSGTLGQSIKKKSCIVIFKELDLLLTTSTPLPLCCLLRDHLTRKCARRSTPSTPTAATRAGSSSAHGI